MEGQSSGDFKRGKSARNYTIVPRPLSFQSIGVQYNTIQYNTSLVDVVDKVGFVELLEVIERLDAVRV